MAAFAGGFDDPAGDESPSKPLPPEDRLWRHPSELGIFGFSLPLDPITVRRRWLAHQPSKASAWTAGLVGALLATGIVALGSHLATAFTAKPTPTLPRSLGATLTSQPSQDLGGVAPLSGVGIGAKLAASITTAGRAIVYLDVSRSGGSVRCLGVGIRADGMLLAPAAVLESAKSVLVTLADGSSYVGDVVGSDISAGGASSGLALVHINGITDLPVAQFDASPAGALKMLAVAVTSPGGSTFSVGTVTAHIGTTTAGNLVLVDSMTTDLTAAAAPLGSLVLGTNARVAGIVTGTSARGALATPAWIATKVADTLASSGAVRHGWLGIEGVTALAPPEGVRITMVALDGAAQHAGLRSGDTIVSIAGHRVQTMADLQARLYFVQPGARVVVSFLRGDHEMSVDTVLDDQQMR